MQLSWKPKAFIHSFFPFMKSTSNFKHFEIKRIVIVTLFWKLQTVKDLDRPLSEKNCFGTPLDSQHVKGSQTLGISPWEHFHQCFSLLWENLICKIYPLVTGYIVGVLRNSLTANDKYPVRDCENLSSLIQMRLSLKRSTFIYSFVPFLEYTLNFKHFEKKTMVIATFFRKLQTVKDLVRQLSRKYGFRTPLDSQHVKESQSFVKYAWGTFIIFFDYPERTWFGKYLP